jgi:hypothetical protein
LYEKRKFVYRQAFTIRNLRCQLPTISHNIAFVLNNSFKKRLRDGRLPRCRLKRVDA